MTPHDAHNRRFIIFCRTRAFRITTTKPKQKKKKNKKKYEPHPIYKYKHEQKNKNADTRIGSDANCDRNAYGRSAPKAKWGAVEKRERAQLAGATRALLIQ